MNRRDFIKSASLAATIPAIAITCKYEDDEKGEEAFNDIPHENVYRWDYRVYCYEREQGEWTFSENIRGSFAPEREYMTFEEEMRTPYAGWMDGGRLHFATLQEAENFIEDHVRVKDDTDIIDSIYDVYYVARNNEERGKEVEIQIAHHWYNENGNQIQWQAKPPYSDINKMEFA